MSTSNVTRKRVVLKVWLKDGQVLDTVHEIEWLERQGWRVECSEKLLEDSTNGVCYVLYVLEWAGAGSVTPIEISPPVPGLDKKPNRYELIPCPPATGRVILSLQATRGRMVVQPLYPWDAPTVLTAVPGSPHAGPSAGIFPIKEFGPDSGRQIAILCVNDAAYSPHTNPSSLPEGEPARMTADAYYLRTPDRLPPNPEPQRLFRIAIPPGEAATFYLEFRV